MIIAIGNIGSTSLKSKIIDITDDDSVRVLGEANLDKIKTPGHSNFVTRIGSGPKMTEAVDVMGFRAGIKMILDWYVAADVISKPADIQAMGFKTVMGIRNGANNLTPEVLEEMRYYGFAAPVHNLPYIEAIGEFRKVLNVPMVGVFEPSFHYSVPEFRRYYGLPWTWHQDLRIRKLGFHGASHRFLAASAFHLMDTDKLRLITVHLGGSSSICAIHNGKSIDISTNFSPNSGLIQGSRPGDIDATSVLFAIKQLGISVDEAQTTISEIGGIKGMAGIGTDDLRAIMDAAEKGNHRCAMTIDLFIDHVRKYIGAYAAMMGGLDCIVFSGGIGENGVDMRTRCLERLAYMGIELDHVANAAVRGQTGRISRGPVQVFVVPTNEELVVAHFTKQVLTLGRDLTPEEMHFRLPQCK